MSAIALAQSDKPRIAQGVSTTEFLHEQDVLHSLLDSVRSQRSLIQQFHAVITQAINTVGVALGIASFFLIYFPIRGN